MIRRQKIRALILGEIVQQSARADMRPVIVVYNSGNRVLLDITEA
jgi:hypothetical protein